METSILIPTNNISRYVWNNPR